MKMAKLSIMQTMQHGALAQGL